MDEKDVKILAAVARFGTGSAEKLADETDIPTSTVHYRLERLRETGIITNDLFDVDLEAVGLNLTVISEVTAEYSEQYHEDVGQELADVEGVNQVYFTMGDTDFVVISHLSSRNMVERLIENFESIDGVEQTSSKFVIKTIKDESRPLNDFDPDTLIALLSADSTA
ncbi:Lrp/AsnC family transcriptional regulator [Haloarcula nitratireducens]|uniref:Lrp/AsnC family transcriptional regulator n=1 Tax=Haloarcula nitratireducens TaxID=2487749 RepID=A0AAW4PIV4_9EURY|nr:Lrp/AsnC family transcriptional regulator [Halomicroarcula nitratireducens]MBX0297483.1 Lrp/AsnC family transcriptional regulator [Halomicroarcula nitratireducens]